MSLWAKYNWGERSYHLDDNDVMWLAKSLWGEAGKHGSEEDYLAVAFCMMQRFLRWPSATKWNFFHQFVRAFSQPVNPIWVNPSNYRRKKFPSLCTPARLRRRRNIVNAPWSDVPENPKRIALGFGIGHYRTSPVPEAVNFGAKGLIKRQGRTGVNVGGNVFIDHTQDKMRWAKGELEIIV